MLGRKKYTFAEAFKPYNTPDIGDGLPGAQPAPLESQYKPGFWQGGDKFGGRDAIAAILASIGDALMRQSGGQGGAVGNLAGGRLSARDMAMKQAQQEQERAALMQAAQARGINPADVTLSQGGLGDLIPKAPDQPERARMAEWYRTATPEQRAAFDATNPIVTQGYGSTVVPRTAINSAIGTGPKPGDVEDGHQFIGGDPSDQNNWKPLGGAGPQTPRPFRYGR